MCINYSFAIFLQSFRFPYALAKIQPRVPRAKLECKGYYPLRSNIHVHCSSPTFSMGPHFRSELTNSSMSRIAVSALRTGYYGCISRSFSSGRKSSLLKKFIKKWKRPNAVSDDKGNVASEQVENVETDAKLKPMKKAKRTSTKKKKAAAKVSALPKSNKKVAVQLDKVSRIPKKPTWSQWARKTWPNLYPRISKSVEKVPDPLESSKKVILQLDKASQITNDPTVSQEGRKTWPQLYPPISKSVLVVESATKAKVIQGYLGEMFVVLPSDGHVRDLAPRSGSVRPDDDFSMVWEVPSAAWSHIKSINAALSKADNLVLASDPDREGEAIAWHIIEMLHQQGALREEVTIARVVFNEITESSIKSALQAPRETDGNLVQAYLARRAVDYLIGFSVAPILWKKLPDCQSAGRVQYAALTLICDIEHEIEIEIVQKSGVLDHQSWLPQQRSKSEYHFTRITFDTF